ncbi:DNA-directed RNA polymerase III subunit RPC7 [[Emmonsia] crescens]|uniref:DNA-directed RNA polymerase III subunit n=1 Tax=[Emmonsia] crescens TaxID=73230 RepID=A0A2B7ZK96_9EURO|nr:DNA-directed RNA polymerase III subunit RPC7 [Emmonsia crescens]
MSRFGANRGKKLPGAEFSWDTEGGGEPDTAPTPLFPKYSVPIARSLTEEERSQVHYYRRLREIIHDGPYYTVLNGSPSSQKGGAAAARKAQFDPFQGMATYGQRYLKKTRTLPKLGGRPYVMNFFPKELWSTLDPKYVGLQAGGADGFGTLLRGGQKRGFEDEEEDEEEVGPLRKRREVGGEEDEEGSETGEKRKRRAGGEDEDLLDEDEDEGEEEIVDDDFEDDEEDMGGDYNAEQYFDGGDDDADGYDGGGGEGDNDTY